MKVKADELFEVVRQVVREEVKKVLPALVAKHLSEAYIKKALAETVQVEQPVRRPAPRPQPQASRLPANLREIIAGTDPDDEVTPEALPNDTMGIYEPANPLVKRNDEAVAKLLSRNNPMADIYEGLQPIDAEDRSPDVPLNQAAKAMGMDFSKMSRLMEGLESDAKSKKSMMVSEDAKLKELERKRRELERPVGPRPKVM